MAEEPFSAPREVPFVTFYSFKGGVGRSMALINVACILAGRGRRVLAIDLDLEAPGISYLLRRENPESVRTPGFVDLIYDLLAEGEKSSLAGGKQLDAYLAYTSPLRIPEHVRHQPDGKLVIMPAGRFGEEYNARRAAIDLPRLYESGKGRPIMRHVRDLIRESGQFDYVLIDSRTGFSDEAGLCIRDLGNHLVVLLGLNRQNVEGTAEFLRQLRRENIETRSVNFVASPIPVGEDKLYEERIEAAQKELCEAWKKPVKFTAQIPYHPRLALDEEPFVFYRSQGLLYEAYRQIEAVVRDIASDTPERWSIEARGAMQKKRHVQALQALKEVSRFNPQQAFREVEYELRRHISDPAYTQYFGFFSKLVDNNVQIFRLVASHYAALNQLDLAETMYREAARRQPATWQKLLLFARFLTRYRKDFAAAKECYRRSVELMESENVNQSDQWWGTRQIYNVLNEFAEFLEPVMNLSLAF